jgi:hypothetical protein
MSVYKAINQVQKALSKTGVLKGRNNEMQNYKFRGIDDIYNALSPLLADAELCILPRVLTRQVVERQTQKGGNLFYVVVESEFDFVSALDGSKHTVKTFGEAMDSADKATNKAMSAAYKYACIQAFSIPTEGDNDADLITHDIIPKVENKTHDELLQKALIAIKNAKDLDSLKNHFDAAKLSFGNNLSVIEAKDKRKLELNGI